MSGKLICVPGADGVVAGVAAEVARLLGLSVRMLPADAAAEKVLRVLAREEVDACVLPSDAGEDLAWRAATATPKPVVLVPPGASLRHPHIERVLLPLDDSEGAAEAMIPVAGHLRAAGVEVVVLHVFDEGSVPAFWDQRAHAHEAWTQAFVERNIAPDDVRMEVRRGAPALHVVRMAALADVDLIALGWSGTTSATRARTVRESVASAPVPVLLQRRENREQEVPEMNAKPGDWLLIRSGSDARPSRRAEILSVGDGGRPPFTVRWLDSGRRSVMFPGPDALVVTAAEQAEHDRRAADRAEAAQREISGRGKG